MPDEDAIKPAVEGSSPSLERTFVATWWIVFALNLYFMDAGSRASWDSGEGLLTAWIGTLFLYVTPPHLLVWLVSLMKAKSRVKHALICAIPVIASLWIVVPVLIQSHF